jgi:formylmethanofuran dehydrogenase subunit E
MKMKTIAVKELNVDGLVEKGIEFHGHLGPVLVIGIKMGIIALKELNSGGYSDMSVVVETGTTPPVSCLIDGIQISSGCTLGKGNIKVIANEKPKAVFTRGEKSLEIELKPEILKRILESGAVEESAGRIARMGDEELFNTGITF